jgi:hypothetical protein
MNLDHCCFCPGAALELIVRAAKVAGQLRAHTETFEKGKRDDGVVTAGGPVEGKAGSGAGIGPIE